MRKKCFRLIGLLIVVFIVFQSIGTPVIAMGEEVLQETESVTVTTSEEFLAALEQEKSSIIINGSITIGEQADSSGKMYPVEIPGGTTIQGTTDSDLNCRCPIQLTGDNITLKDLKITFESSDALGSVPHREIFLAGHSMTMDNVETYLEGSAGSLGGLGSSEEELLPTVYAGGFENTSIGTNAELTVRNGNSKTMFKGIYMSHGSDEDNKVAYTGTASVKISPKIVVREGIYTQQNSNAEIFVSGSGYISELKVYGNENTTLCVNQSYLYRTVLNEVENLKLEDGAYLELQQGDLENVTLQNKACLDLNNVLECNINGNFVGGIYDIAEGTDTTGILVTDKEGSINIKGTVENTTIFQTENHNFPGEYISDKKYINAVSVKEGAVGFVLPDSKITSYKISYEEDGWTVYEENSWPLIENIDIISAPAVVDVNTIKGVNYTPAEQAPYCSVFWMDKDGNAFSTSIVEDYYLYYYDIVIPVKTSYWTSEESKDEEDWGNTIQFVSSEKASNQYYFYAEESEQVKLGEYTFLFFSECLETMPSTMSELKALKEKVKAEMTVYFYDSTEEHDPDAIDIGCEDVQMENIEAQIFTGKMLTPDVRLTKDQMELVRGKDYLVTYENSVQAGNDAKAIVIGIGNYYGKREMTFSIIEGILEPTVTVSPSPSITVSPSATMSPSPSITISPSATVSTGPSITASPSATVSPSPNITASPSATASPSPSIEVSPSATASPGATASPSPSATESPSPNITASPSPSIEVSPSVTASPSATASPSPSIAVSPSVIASPSAIVSPSPSIEVSPSVTESPGATASPSPSVTLSPGAATSPNPTLNPSATPTLQVTLTPSPALTATLTSKPAPTSGTAQTPTPTHSHIWNSGVVTKEPTVLTNGQKIYTCITCGAKKIEAIPALKVPEKGTILTDKKSKAKYKVTKSGKRGGTVEYVRSVKANTKKVVIPEKVTIDGIEYKVTSVASKAFYNCKKLKYVTIGKNVKKIGTKAFYGCKSLKIMTIKTTKLTQKTIGKNAFAKVNKRVTVKVPSKKMKNYKKILKSKGMNEKARFKKYK